MLPCTALPGADETSRIQSQVEHHSATEPTVADGHIWKKVEPWEKGALKALWNEGMHHLTSLRRAECIRKRRNRIEPEFQIPKGPFQNGQKPAGGEQEWHLGHGKGRPWGAPKEADGMKSKHLPFGSPSMFPSQLLQLQNLSFYHWSWAKCYTKQNTRLSLEMKRKIKALRWAAWTMTETVTHLRMVFPLRRWTIRAYHNWRTES